jgi:hypothetical protein
MTRNARKSKHRHLTEQHREARWLRRLRRGSVQQGFVRVRSVHDHLLCLAVPGNRQVYEFVTILEIEGISYDLKSPEEQRLLNEQFQALLAGLHYPIQILWRVLPLRLQEYLAHFSLDESHLNGSEDELLQELAYSHTTFLRQHAARRTLLHRRVYLVLRTEAVSSPQSQWQTLFRRKQRRNQRFAKLLEHARQTLDLRVEELTRMLNGMMNLPVRRLRGPQELAPFYYSCLTPQKADQYPLPNEVLDALERPIHAADITGKLGRKATFAPPFEDAQDPPSGTRKRTDQGRDEAQSDLTSLSDLTAPAGILLAADHLTVEHEQVRVLIIQHLPRVVSSGWLKPLADLDEPMEVSFHLQPRHSAFMVQQFRRRQMEYQSSRQLARSKGNEVDPHTKIAEEDVSDLIMRLASGEERMLDVTILVLLRGATRRMLDERTERVRATLHNMLLVAREALFEQDKAFRSCLPHGRNELSGILLDSRSASTLFPFLSNSLFHPDGILEGITPQGDPVLLDAWGPDMANANRIILGPPGWGKSHYVKTMLMRLALKYRCAQQQSGMERNFQLITIDPEREYGRVALPFHGQMVRLAPGSQHHLNPFDLPRPTSEDIYEHGDRLADHIQRLHTLLEIMLADRTPQGAGRLSSQEKGLLDRALYEAYRKVGITSEVKTHDRPAPLMRDLYDVLESGVCGPDVTGLTPRLQRFVHGSLAGLFAGPTNVQLDQMIVNFDIHDLETELRPIGLFLVSNFVWTESFHSRIPRLLVVDEAATLYHYESGAAFLEDFVRRARKYYVGVILISQHPLLFQQSSIPANCATKVLMRQDATTLDLLEQMLKLSWREVQLLRHLPIGEALLLTGEKRLHVRFEASELEHLLATTDPQEIAAWGEEGMLSSPECLLARVRSLQQEGTTHQEKVVSATGEQGQEKGLIDFQPVHAIESQNNHVNREVTDAFDPGD